MAKESAWYNLDNAANIYPAVSNDRNTNVYRFSCELKDNIKQNILKKAVDKALKAYPSFRVIMRRGLFWYYLEGTQLEPTVTLESERPCKRIFYNAEKELLFHVTYYGHRINLEAFHALADGGGIIDFFRFIIYHYIVTEYKELLPAHLPSIKVGAPPSSQSEDSFNKHYLPGDRKGTFKHKSYTLSGTTLPSNSLSIIMAHMPVKETLALCKSKQATLTAYLTSLMLCAIYEEHVPRRYQKREIGITIPVDLRGFFSSQTARNFFGVVDIRYNFDDKPVDFNVVLQSVTKQLVEKVNKGYLESIINYNMGVQTNIFARMVPLFLKNIVLRAAYRKNESTTATTISNLGRIIMPEEFASIIENFSCLLNPSPIQKTKLSLVSYNNTLMLSFTSNMEETNIQKYIIRHFSSQGIPVEISTNGGDIYEAL